jgi:uncharacterized protein YjbI with pentapeptide repeats
VPPSGKGAVVFDDHDAWAPAHLPQDPVAAQRLQEWLARGEGQNRRCGLDAVGLDLRGADLSGGDFSQSWFTEATLTGVRLVRAELYRADAQGADLSGADLTGGSLVRVNLDEAVLRDAVLDGADLVKASLWGVDATGASCRGTRFMGAALLRVDLRAADLRGAVFDRNAFHVTLDENTKLHGATGSVFGPVTLVDGAGRRELHGAELGAWLSGRGAVGIQVVPPAP